MLGEDLDSSANRPHRSNRAKAGLAGIRGDASVTVGGARTPCAPRRAEDCRPAFSPCVTEALQFVIEYD